MRHYDDKILEQFVAVDTEYHLGRRRLLVYPLIIAGAAAIFALFTLLGTKIAIFRGTALTFSLFALVIAFLATRSTTKRKYIEFEYSFCGGGFSVSRITDKSKRKDQIGFDCSQVVSLSHKYDPTASPDVERRFSRIYDYSSSEDSPDRWFVAEDHQGAGRFLFIIEPNEKMLSALREYIPRQAQQE